MTRIQWLGHAGFVLESKERSRIAIDVWVRGPTFPKDASLAGVRILALTHGHFDHAEDAPDVANQSGATVVSNFEVSLWVQRRGVAEEKSVGMNLGGTYEAEGWALTMVKAEHSSGCPGGPSAIVDGGNPAGFVVRSPDGDVLYHAGDTTVFGDMQLIRELYAPTVALLPIGGHFTMGPREAAKAVELLGVRHVVPMHYGTFPVLRGRPDDLQKLLQKRARVHEMAPGSWLELGPAMAR